MSIRLKAAGLLLSSVAMRNLAARLTAVPPAAPLFSRRRMRVYPRIMLAVYGLSAVLFVAISHRLVDPLGKPLGYDFITFWSASHLTLEGRPEAAFDRTAIQSAEQLAVPGSDMQFLWHYPPTYQLAITPLALLPYIPVYLLFVVVTLLAYLITTRRLLDQPEPVLLLLAFPATFICAFHGQNSFISAALFAGAILCLRERPGLSGILLGLLAFKPQLGLLVPIGLIAARQWRVFLFAALTSLAYAGLSTLVFGIDLWRAFLQDGPVVRVLLEQHALPWAKMPTAFVFLRLLGCPQAVAYGFQVICALAAALAVAFVWRRRGADRLSGATLVAATLLVSPYLFDYELAILAVPLAILSTDMARRGALAWERASLLLLFAFPAFMAGIAETIHLQLGFPALLLALVLCCSRALSGLDDALARVDDGRLVGIDPAPSRTAV